MLLRLARVFSLRLSWYFCAWDATCAGVRVGTYSLATFVHLFPNVASPSKNALCSSMVHGDGGFRGFRVMVRARVTDAHHDRIFFGGKTEFLNFNILDETSLFAFLRSL